MWSTFPSPVTRRACKVERGEVELIHIYSFKLKTQLEMRSFSYSKKPVESLLGAFIFSLFQILERGEHPIETEHS